MSLRTVTTSVVDGMHNVWTMHVPRAQRRWQAHCRARSRWMCQRRAGRRSASGQCLKHHIQLLTCKRVLPRESMCTAGEARTHGACVTSVLCTRVLVCKAQSSERRRGSGEAKPGARHPLCALFFALEQKREACIYRTQRLNPIGSQPRRARGSCCLGRRQHNIGGDGGAVGDAALSRVDGHGAQAIHGGSKRKEEDQKDGSTASSTRAARRR